MLVSCALTALAARAVIWSSRAQTDADAVALAYVANGSAAALRLAAAIGARVESSAVIDDVASLVVSTRWGVAVSSAKGGG